MKKRLFLNLSRLLSVTLLALIIPGTGGVSAAHNPLATKPDHNARGYTHYDSPLLFIENVGQFNPRVRYQIRNVYGGELWLTDNALWITILEPLELNAEEPRLNDTRSPDVDIPSSTAIPNLGVNLRISFVDANPDVRIESFNRLDTAISYFLGNDPAHWRSNVPVWGGVRYKDLYPGIDLEFTSENGQLVQRVVASPGGNLAMVRMRVEGADTLAVDGDLLRIQTAAGESTLPLLKVTGFSSTATIPINWANLASPMIIDDQVALPFAIKPEMATSVQRSQVGPAAILNQPDLLYSTFLGGTNIDDADAITVDASEATYVAGRTRSSNFPTTPGAYQTTRPGGLDDIFVTKLNAAGSGLVYSTFLGGGDTDYAFGIAVDIQGAAYVVGRTLSANYPTTPGAFDRSLSGYDDAYVTKLSADGSLLLYSTLLGGSTPNEGILDVALDSTGAAYVIGVTGSSDFPTTDGAIQTTYGGGIYDAFVTKVSADGSGLIYSTYLGGSNTENDNPGFGIAVGGDRSAFVTGNTRSTDFPTTAGAFQPILLGSGANAYVTKLNPSGSGLVYSTYLGGGHAEGYDIAVDNNGAAFVAGEAAANFPTTAGAFQPAWNGGLDAFITKLKPDGSALIYSTYLGGSRNEWSQGIALDEYGGVTVTGYTSSLDFPTSPEAFDITFGGGSYDAYATKLTADGSDLLYSTYLGDSSLDAGLGVATDRTGAAYITGFTHSLNFPTTPGAFNISHNGWVDAFVTKLRMGGAPPLPGAAGSLSLAVSLFYLQEQPVTFSVGVSNPTSIQHTYNVFTFLFRDGNLVDSQLHPVTVPGSAKSSLDLAFGPQPPGNYEIIAQLLLDPDPAVIDETSLSLQVYEAEDQIHASIAGMDITGAALVELLEAASIVVRRYVDTSTTFALEAASLAIGLLFPVGDVVADFFKGLSREAVKEAVGQVIGWLSEKILGLLFGTEIAGGVEYFAMSSVAESLAPQQLSVYARQDVYNTFIVGRGAFTWTSGMDDLVIRRKDVIGNRTEFEIIPGFMPPPLPPIAPTTLEAEDFALGFYLTSIEIIDILITIAALILIVWLALLAAGASVPSFGLSIEALLAAIPAVLTITGVVLLTSAAALFLLTVVMHMQTEFLVGPAVTREHDLGLDALSQLIQESSGVSFEDFRTEVSLKGSQVTLSTGLTNADFAPARPVVETYLYSADGRIVEILSQQPDMAAGSTATWQETITLPAGRYQAVTAIHTKNEIGVENQMTELEVSGPSVSLKVGLVESQLLPGQALHAAISLTNTNVITETGDLLVWAQSNDNQHVKTWKVNLPPAASESLEYHFAPQAEGSYRLRVAVTDGLNLLVWEDSAYVVGTAGALALDFATQAAYLPGMAVTFPITVTNAGNLPVTSTLSLVSLDRLHERTSIYTDTLSLSVGAETSVSTSATALPPTLAQPGFYSALVFLGEDLYTNLDFLVAAEDTLFASITPAGIYHSLGDTVPLAVSVTNSGFNPTDASIEVSVWQPDGFTQDVAMNRLGPGEYQGFATTPISGTYVATVEVNKSNHRSVGSSNAFIVDEISQLQASIEGRPYLDTISPVTITVHNQVGTPVVEASLVISGTNEYLSLQTDGMGQAVLQLSPVLTDSYQIKLEKTGFVRTEMSLPVWIIQDMTPPKLALLIPSVTNQSPLTVKGLTEAGARLTINDQPVSVDASGYFTSTITLSEGFNSFNINATDESDNTTEETRTVILDTTPSTLTVTYPPEGFMTSQEVIQITGKTEEGARVQVNGVESIVNPDDGSFSAWVSLQFGRNIVSIVAIDEAGNLRKVNRIATLISKENKIYLPVVFNKR